LLSRVSIDAANDVLKRGSLRWFKHVLRKSTDDWMERWQDLKVVDRAGRGSCWKTWFECVRGDMKDGGLC